MTPNTPNPARGGAAGSGNDVYLLSSSAADVRIDSPPGPNPQDNNRARDFRCASMRAAELRDCLVREILRASAIGMQAQAALLDGDDEAALGHLRRHWIVMRTDVSPMASELGSLLKELP